MTARLLLLFLLLFAPLSYAQDLQTEQKKDTIAPRNLPRIIAILPFVNVTEEKGLHDQVRRSFYNHFSSKSFTDVELAVVDEKVIHLEKSTGKKISDLTPKVICEAMGCDGLVYGTVTDFRKVYALVYSQLAVDAEVRMVDAHSGKEVLKLKESVKYHEGGVPTTPLGALMTAVSTALNLREIQQVRMISELAYRLNEKIPSPEGMAAEERPMIREVITNAGEGPFGKAKVIRAGLEGDKGLVATFSIGNFRKGLAMKETKPGIYVGEYSVMPGDNTRDMPVIVSLKKPGGREHEWFDVSGVITIDTLPPPVVGGLRAKGLHDVIAVSWDGLRNIPDLKEYRVLRSEQPLSGYEPAGTTETTAFDDTPPDRARTYFYRVVARDVAGNESEPQDGVKASLAGKEPVVLGGEITRDTSLSGVYLVKGELVVLSDRSLTLEAGTKIFFDPMAGLTIRGRLIVQGNETPVELLAPDNRQWKGVTVEHGAISAHGLRIRGAAKGLLCINSEGLVEGGLITGNDTGMLIEGTPSPTVRNTTISQNRRGLELTGTDAKIVENHLFQNDEGVVLQEVTARAPLPVSETPGFSPDRPGLLPDKSAPLLDRPGLPPDKPAPDRGRVAVFSGEIKENNIMDNGTNMLSQSPVKVGANYFGYVHVEEMRLKNVAVTRVYNQKIPGGTIVEALSDPYVHMSREVRENKGLSLFKEGLAYFEQRNYGKASTIFEEALKAFPSAEGYYYLALCHREMRDDDRAAMVLKDGVSRFPRDSTLVKALGLLFYEKGDEKEARRFFEEGIRLNPQDRQLRFLLERIGQ